MAHPEVVAPARQDADRGPATWAHLVPWLAVAVVVLGRLPHLASALGIDESGFLLVGGQWAPGGRSLYGDYFVDRPPLLLSVYQVAAALGGAIPLRVIGVLAAVLAVLATGRAARRCAGPRAGGVAALLVALLMVNPMAGTREVNGELLAAPLVALALAGGVELVVAATARERFLGSVMAGACATAAVLVKQNMLDGWVFVSVLAVLTLRPASGRSRRVAASGLGLGAGAVLGLTAVWTRLHGTSLRGVFYAMYPFRWQAAHVLARTPSDAAARRTVQLVGFAVASGLVLLLAALLIGAFSAWRSDRTSLRGGGARTAVLLASAAAVAYGVVSVMAGGSYWRHYLTELVVPLGLGAGVAIGAWSPRLRRGLVGLLCVSAVVGAVGWPGSTASGGERVGEAIRAVSAPQDTIVTIWGHSDVDYASGLTSPYPQLWSLPTRTLDPRLDLLTHTLESSAGPTWLVVWPHLSHSAVRTSGLQAAVAQHYRPVAVCPHWTVFLRDGTRRPSPDVCRPAGR